MLNIEDLIFTFAVEYSILAICAFIEKLYHLTLQTLHFLLLKCNKLMDTEGADVQHTIVI